MAKELGENASPFWRIGFALVMCVIIVTGCILIFGDRHSGKDDADTGNVVVQEPVENEAEQEDTPVEDVPDHIVTGAEIKQKIDEKEGLGFGVYVCSNNLLRLSPSELEEEGIGMYTKYSVLSNETGVVQEILFDGKMVPLKFLNFNAQTPSGVLYRFGESGFFVTDGEMPEPEDADNFPYRKKYKKFIHNECSYRYFTVYDPEQREVGIAYIEEICKKDGIADE